MINNRQAGRRRGRNNNGGGNGPRQGGGRGDNGNRIDSRARGNAAQLLEKYKNLASDAQRQGDRVNTEYYLQFADHYFRVLADQRGRFEDQQPRRQQNDFDEGGDDYGDEGEPIRSGEQGEGRPERNDRERNDRDDRQQNDRYQNDRPRADRQQGDRDQGERADGDRQPSERRPRDGQGFDGQSREPRAERPRRWERDERPRGDEVEVSGQRRADPPVAGEDLEARAEAVLEADAPLADPAPRRRGRPRRDAAPVDAQPFEGAPEGMDADRLPPALGIAAANDADDGEEAPKPRRRRVRAVTPEA